MTFPKSPSFTMTLPGRQRGNHEHAAAVATGPPAFVGKLTTCAGLLSLVVLLLGKSIP